MLHGAGRIAGHGVSRGKEELSDVVAAGQSNTLEAQADAFAFVESEVTIHVGEERRLKVILPSEDGHCYASSYSFGIDAYDDDNEGVTIKGVYSTSGTVTMTWWPDDGGDGVEASIRVNVIERPDGYEYVRGTTGGVSWNTKREGDENVMTIWPTDGVSGTAAAWDVDSTTGYGTPWRHENEYVTIVRIEPGVKLQTCLDLFDSFHMLKAVEGLENLDTSSVTSMNYAFRQCFDLQNVDGLEKLDLSNVTDMGQMFEDDDELTHLDLSSFDMSKVTNASLFDNQNLDWAQPRLTRLVLSDKYLICDEDDIYYPLPSASITYPYTGKWVEESDQDDANAKAYSYQELIELYKKSPRNATWVAQLDPAYIASSDNTLENLRRSLTKAQAAEEKAKASRDEAQAEYESAKKSYEELDAQIGDARRDADEKKAAWEAADAAAKKKESLAADAQAALDQNTADIAAAQEDVRKANAALDHSVVEQAEQRVSEAQAAVTDAESGVAQAQAAIDAEVADPGTNEGHKEWTAYGLFQYIRDNSPEGSAAYWDAQCAMDILDSGTNSTGHAYGRYEGPETDGYNAASQLSISQKVGFAERTDAVSLDNLAFGLDLVDKFNEYRARENAAEGTNLSTVVGTNCRQLAISIVQCDASAQKWGHTQAYDGLENLAQGYANPYDGWYDAEKKTYQRYLSQGLTYDQIVDSHFGEVGHYLTVVDMNSGTYANVVGGARNSRNNTTEISLRSIFSAYPTVVPEASVSYSVGDFRTQWFEPYYEAQVQAGMFGTGEEQRTQNRNALVAAQNALTSAQADLTTAQAELTSAQENYNNAQQMLEDAQARLTTERSKTQGLQDKLTSAQNAATQARSAANAAKDAYDEAEAEVKRLDPDGALDKAKKEYDDAASALDKAKKAYTQAQQDVKSAQAGLDSFTDLGTSGAISVERVAGFTYSGRAIAPKPVVTAHLSESEDVVLSEGVDYTLSYANNVNAGTAMVTIKGTGSKGSGTWWGTRSVSFAIDATPLSAAAVTLAKTSFAYNGKAQIPAVSAVVLDGQTLIAGRDYSVSYKNNVNAGIGTVVVTGMGNYAGSKAVTFQISKAASTISLAAQTKTYTGKAIAYTGKVTKSGSTGTVTYKYFSDAACTKEVAASKVKNAGTYYVRATLAADANHKAATSKVAKLTVKKAAQPMKLKAVKRTAKASKLKKGAVTVARPLKFTKKAQGKVTYARVAKGSAKCLTVNKKTGKVTVKQGTKKGAYTVKIKVTAKGDANYKAGSKTVTCKVIVK